MDTVTLGNTSIGPHFRSRRSYHYGERLTAIEAGAAKYGLHLDPLGSVVEVTGDAGPDCARTYDPWGKYAESGPCAADPKLAYTGHEYDQASGLYNFGARYYDSATARFTTLDPYFGETSTPPSLHKYLYAYANPYRWVDLEGYVSKYFQELLKEKFGDVQDYTSEHMQFIVVHSEQMQARNDARANRSVTAHHIEFEHLDSYSRTDVALAREGYYQQNELLYRANKHGSEIVAQIKADTAQPDIDPVDIVAGVAAAGIVQSGKNVIRSTVLKNIEASQSARRGSGFSEFIKREGALQEGLGIYPPNNGRLGPVEIVALREGETFSRFGPEIGRFVSPVDVKFEERSIQLFLKDGPYNEYVVIKPIEGVIKSRALPWFGKPGKGVQYEFKDTIKWLLDNGYIKGRN